jgi:hypothetical protein
MADGETRHLRFRAGATCHGTTTQPVPLGAKGLLVTLTAVEPAGNGNLTLYDPFPPTGETEAPGVSSLNFTAGQNASTSVTTALGQWPDAPDAALAARVADAESAGVRARSVHVVVDVVGYLTTAP